MSVPAKVVACTSVDSNRPPGRVFWFMVASHWVRDCSVLTKVVVNLQTTSACWLVGVDGQGQRTEPHESSHEREDDKYFFHDGFFSGKGQCGSSHESEGDK